jgi:hypothetical protein
VRFDILWLALVILIFFFSLTAFVSSNVEFPMIDCLVVNSVCFEAVMYYPIGQHFSFAISKLGAFFHFQ